jgi:CBS domain-containing protein
MRVRDLLGKKRSQGAVTIMASADVATAARMLMHHNIGGLPVVGIDGSLVGFLAERDIVQAVNRTPGGVRDLPVELVMCRPAPTCSADDSLHEVMARMNHERLRHVVVLDGRSIAGILSVGDLVKHRVEELELETGVLRDFVLAQRARS